MFAAVTPVPLPPLEMTMNVWVHRDKGGFSERNHKAALPNLCAATTHCKMRQEGAADYIFAFLSVRCLQIAQSGISI